MAGYTCVELNLMPLTHSWISLYEELNLWGIIMGLQRSAEFFDATIVIWALNEFFIYQKHLLHGLVL